jgi:tRNA (guanine37-N1)-methyltransferase
MNFSVLTLFPEMFAGFLSESILGSALENGIISIDLVNIRDFATDKHRTTDDYPYGGGHGMIMKCEPVVGAVDWVKENKPGFSKAKVVFMTPQGRKLNQEKLRFLSREEALVLICGHYKGIDERIRESVVDEEISVGDYVLSGGEIPAMILIDGITRLLPGSLGDPESAMEDSHMRGLLDCPWYTRPEEFRGEKVPGVLLSGNHQEVDEWRRKHALIRTARRRPDLISSAILSEKDKQYLRDIGVEI